MTRRVRKSNRQRLLLTQEAARILDASGNRDYLAAKRKAAEHLRVTDTTQLPSNKEIEQALIEYQRLFHSDNQPQTVYKLRQAAFNAMQLLKHYSPRLVGAVLAGTADQHSVVHLHVFTDTNEDINLFLFEKKIPFDMAEQKVRLSVDNQQTYAAILFMAGECRFQLTVFPTVGQRQAPLSPIDGKPMKRATITELEQLLKDDSPDDEL